MMRKILAYLLLALAPITMGGCKTLLPIIVDQGPAILRAATSQSVHRALVQAQTPNKDVADMRGYLADAKALLNGGKVPAYTLDNLAAHLNQKISSPLVRSAIQGAISILKTQVTIPVTGFIPQGVKTLVIAVLDGADDGCLAYLSRILPAAGPALDAPDYISFR